MPSSRAPRGPSKSCGNCRLVKRRRPHCGQCIRMHEECPGYRDEWELVFRDQTSHTIKRSQEKDAKRNRKSTSPPIRPPTPELNEVGVNYFLCSFVNGGGQSSRGYLNYIPSVYFAEGEHPILTTSMAAVGLVALANSTRQPWLAVRARAKYADAISRVNAALASPVESVKDSTLMAVISLGVFEHLSEHKSWVRHVRGAVAVVAARGKKQFSSPSSLLMFNQVRADMIIASINFWLPFPKEILELQEEAAKYMNTSGAFWQLGVLGARCIDILGRVRTNTVNKDWEFLEEAIVLEREYINVLDALAMQEPYYTTILTSVVNPEVVYNNRADRYNDFWSIRVWNNGRCCYMIVAEIKYHYLLQILRSDLAPPVRQKIQLKFQETVQALRKTSHDILATVPQALEFLSTGSEMHPSVDLSFRGKPNVSGGYILAWGLYMAGKCLVIQDDTRQWVVQCLQYIGNNMGVLLALEIAENIEKGPGWGR
ncbi:transcriptional regulator family: Fungal Specific TF [Penicillium macrosclerotiorum]|uniref:transcriptional regulator family: Fungal Specific TF n=1 Tax=Penicillium macrosclerotiorum TaxID=303699 RepID=UPI0025465961|nr:transcriptional regulator family: Fungal Specific TF [Penicillium macrosclerotiorum]KAJ5698617.1 transcriptional regulator family: Fungal Specific TF [Penicillium macrosclerotiorum]